MARARIDWSMDERTKWFNAAVEMLKQAKFKQPKNWVELSGFMKILRQAEVVLAEHRRRDLASIDAIKLELPKFIEMGFLPANVGDLRKGVKAKDVVEDPNTLRLNQLADERDAAVKLAEEVQEQNNGLAKQVVALRSELSRVPTEAQVLKTFIADILADVQARGRALPGPTGDELNRVTREAAARTTLHIPKHNPEPTSEERSRKPTVAVFRIETAPSHLDKWQHQFPDIDIREIPVRADGKVHVPTGAMQALLLHGVRHATTEEVRRSYPGAAIGSPAEVHRILASINERVKGEKHA